MAYRPSDIAKDLELVQLKTQLAAKSKHLVAAQEALITSDRVVRNLKAELEAQKKQAIKIELIMAVKDWHLTEAQTVANAKNQELVRRDSQIYDYCERLTEANDMLSIVGDAVKNLVTELESKDMQILAGKLNIFAKDEELATTKAVIIAKDDQISQLMSDCEN
jgi:hypothetical protein